MIVMFRKNLGILILLSSITLITANEAHPPPKSVNLALETSFLFDPKDLHQNKYLVSNIREFLDKLLMVIDPQKPRFREQSKRRDTKHRTDSKEKLEHKTETGTSITNVLDFVKNVGQTFVNVTGNKIAEAVNNMHVGVITEPDKSNYKGTTAIPEEVIDPQKPRNGFIAQDKRRDTKQELEERTDSIEKLENKTETGTSIKNVLDFVKNVGQTFVNLSGNKIAEVVSNMHFEVITKPTKSKYKGTTAIPEKANQDRMDKYDKKDIKAIISNSIYTWMRRYPEEIRTMINNTVNDTNLKLNTFARRINNYYSDDDINNLKKLLKKFKRRIENNQDTTKIVNELLNNAVFKKFGSLNESTKLALMEDLKFFSEMLLSNDVFKGVNEHFAVFTRKSLPNPKIETGNIRNIDDITYTNLRRSIDNKLTETREKNEDYKKKKSNTNELVVDSAEFLARSARKP